MPAIIDQSPFRSFVSAAVIVIRIGIVGHHGGNQTAIPQDEELLNYAPIVGLPVGIIYFLKLLHRNSKNNIVPSAVVYYKYRIPAAAGAADSQAEKKQDGSPQRVPSCCNKISQSEGIPREWQHPFLGNTVPLLCEGGRKG